MMDLLEFSSPKCNLNYIPLISGKFSRILSQTGIEMLLKLKITSTFPKRRPMNTSTTGTNWRMLMTPATLGTSQLPLATTSTGIVKVGKI